jgi:hypothetical protein
MHRSSESIAAIATALAKAQAEINNPERTLTATILSREGDRTFRYASLATGLDLVRKCLGQHQIAVMQITAIDQGQIMLTTLLVHTSGEWISSIWPVCPATEPSAHLKGAALTYARRYALFAIVGIAGEDDLDAPDLVRQTNPTPPEQPPRKSRNGAMHSPRVTLSPDQSALQRDSLLREISSLASEEALAIWAHRALPIKNSLTPADSQTIEFAYLTQVDRLSSQDRVSISPERDSSGSLRNIERSETPDHVAPIIKQPRKRSKAHLAFVASRPCVICGATPCDAHHIKIAQPHSLGRKVSDEFTVPLCRPHHQELHRHGNERTWWANVQIAPIPIAKELWEKSPVQGDPTPPSQQIVQPSL